ncbi:MAG: hypothetical protein AAFQ63_01765 [Cyanobacteria bacterium J06621_11]
MAARRRGLLRLAENIVVLASVAGAIASFTTQRPAYAVAPLSLAAALNLLNRRQTEQQLDKTATELGKQVLEQLPPIHAFDQLNQRLDIVGQQGLRRQETLNNLIETLTQQTKVVQAATEDIQSVRVDAGKQQSQLSAQTEDIQSIRADIIQQQTQLSAQDVRSDIEVLSASLRQAKAEIESAIANFNKTLDTRTQETADSLTWQQAQLDETLAVVQRLTAEQQTQFLAKSSQLEKDNTELYQRVDRLVSELSVLTQRVDELPSIPSMASPSFSPLKQLSEQQLSLTGNPTVKPTVKPLEASSQIVLESDDLESNVNKL